MTVEQVFSGIISPEKANLSDRFTDAVGFYIYAPFLAAEEIEYGVDVYLQVYLGTQVRNMPLGKIQEGSVILNLIDTEMLHIIPEELQDTGVELALLFLPSESVYLEVFALRKETSLTDVIALLDDINQKLTQQAFVNTATIANELAQNTALVALSGGLSASLAPITAGLSLSIAPGTAAPLAGGTSILKALPGL